ncbi:MAG TPA: aldehyde dehydrogenase family protein [Terriglobia bacterium]|nr:aldehyde dehydrogenase family protein [Terriglobia bacterium]
MAVNVDTVFAPSPYTDFDNQYIDGIWRPGHRGATTKDLDPYTGKTLIEIPLADPTDVDEAFRSAAIAQPLWAAVLPRARATMLRRVETIMDARREEIVTWLIHESGSTRMKAEFEWELAHDLTVAAASFSYQVPGRITPIDDLFKESRVYRNPVGVIGVISPWNFPMYLSLRAVAPALALGNAVVVKPSEDTPITGGLLIAKIFQEAGLPSGLLNVVVGKSSDIGGAFTSHPIPRVISFTGSTAAGRQVAASAAQSPLIKRVMLELGGNTPLIVLDDADIEQASSAAVFGRYLHSGQICMSTNRIIVDEKVSDEFEDRFTDKVTKLKYGDPAKPDTVVGPLINSKQLERLMTHIKAARDEGAREVLAGEPQGLVVPPHIFADVTNNMKVAKAELFGPVAQIIKVKGDLEALSVANDTEYGLSSAVFSGDRARALQLARGLLVGMTHVNDSSVNDKPNVPFGGEKNSGIGRFGGEWVIEEFTTSHWVTVQHSPRRYPF